MTNEAKRITRRDIAKVAGGSIATMWAELVVDEDGTHWWRCNEEGSRTEATDYDIVNLSAAVFPVGSRLTITEPQQ